MTDPMNTLDSATKTKVGGTKVGLMSLPAELRLAIYEFYFENAHLLKPAVINVIEGDLFTWTTPNQSLVEPSLLNASPQLRSETLSLYLKKLRKAGAKSERDLGLISKPGSKQFGGWYHVAYNEVYLQGQIRVLRQKIEDVEQEMD